MTPTGIDSNTYCHIYSDDVRDLTFTVIIDMRKSTWTTVKPILKVLQENFASQVHTAYIIKPDNTELYQFLEYLRNEGLIYSP